MALYFECRINKHTPSDCFFGNFAHWEGKADIQE